MERLPSYEEATGRIEIRRLPRYRPKIRHHPYSRFRLQHATGSIPFPERLFNTIYDESYVPLEVPPAPIGPRPFRPLIPCDMETLRLEVERIEAIRRINRISPIILREFILGLDRAHRRHRPLRDNPTGAAPTP